MFRIELLKRMAVDAFLKNELESVEAIRDKIMRD